MPDGMPEVMRPKRIAIIGAGASGIAALCVIARSPVKHDITVFEGRDVIGGLWVYDDKRGPMYKNLKSNIGKEAMTMPGFPFRTGSSYVTHADVAVYLRQCYDAVGGERRTKFNTFVSKVTPLVDGQWEVGYKTKHKENSEVFDFVFVCTGRYDRPNSPNIEGLAENFRGRVMHSCEYRDPQDFAGQRVLVLGAGNSGQDIAAELAQSASEIYISHNRSPLTCALPAHMLEVAGVTSCDSEDLILSDGSRLPHPDVVIFATGYSLTFPFLDASSGISVYDDYVFPLYKQFISVSRPSLFMYGICMNVAPIPLFYMQSQLALAIIEGRHVLPSREEMLGELCEEVRAKMSDSGRPKAIHMITHEQWALSNELARLAGCAPLTAEVAGVFYRSDYMRRSHLLYYRSYTFAVDESCGSLHMLPLNGAPDIPEAMQLSTMPPAVMKLTGSRPEGEAKRMVEEQLWDLEERTER